MAEQLSIYERYKQKVREAREFDQKASSQPRIQSKSVNNTKNNTVQKKGGCGCGRKK